MSINTNQKLYSAMTPMMPWRGLRVLNSKLDGNGVDYVNETHTHVGTLQALDYMYGGVMAVTYRPGVDATGDLVLGTLRSDAVSAGSQMYFLSLDNLLGVGELAIATPAASSTNTALSLSNVAVSTAALSTNDGTVVAPIGRAIEFTVALSTSAFANVRAPILVQWPTDTASNINNLTVYIDVEFNA